MAMRTGMALLAVCLSGAAAEAADLDAKTKAELLAVRDSAWYAWFGNDQAKLKELLPPDAVTISAGDPTWHDLAGVLQSAADFATTGSKLTRLAFPRTEVQAYGDTAFVYSLYEFDLEGPQGKRSASGRATEVFVRQNGRWIHPGWHLDSGR
jgi:ketosteroid isomerase-like protein